VKKKSWGSCAPAKGGVLCPVGNHEGLETAIRARKSADPLQRITPSILVALVFGAFVVYGVGFAGPATIHNAAHDVRHAFAFPWH